MNDFESNLLERLAAQEHERWSHWQKYLHSKLQRLDNGNLMLPKELYDRWARQVNTPYSKLSETEKDSDRKEALKTIELLKTLSIIGI